MDFLKLIVAGVVIVLVAKIFRQTNASSATSEAVTQEGVDTVQAPASVEETLADTGRNPYFGGGSTVLATHAAPTPYVATDYLGTLSGAGVYPVTPVGDAPSISGVRQVNTGNHLQTVVK